MGKFIAPDRFWLAIENYNTTKVKETQRLGQFLCNTFNITDPDVFYEENNNAAFQDFYEEYVNEN